MSAKKDKNRLKLVCRLYYKYTFILYLFHILLLLLSNLSASKGKLVPWLVVNRTLLGQFRQQILAPRYRLKYNYVISSRWTYLNKYVIWFLIDNVLIYYEITRYFCSRRYFLYGEPKNLQISSTKYLRRYIISSDLAGELVHS